MRCEDAPCCGCCPSYYDHDAYDDMEQYDDRDDARYDDVEEDHILEQQELEDFEQADEYFGHYNDWE